MNSHRYMLTDQLIDGYCFGLYQSLEDARDNAYRFPKAVHIVEYRKVTSPGAKIGKLIHGMVPTGVSYPIEDREKS